MDLDSNHNQDADQKSRFYNLTERFSLIFTKHEYDIRHMTLAERKINTESKAPIKQLPYRVLYKRREMLTFMVRGMADQGIATSSQSLWSSPVILVSKKDGGYRFCIAYRKINALT